MSSYGSMQHLNGNLLAAVDVETTGLVCGEHDIWEMAVIPLDHNFKPNKIYKPWIVRMKPKRPENIDKQALAMTGLKPADVINEGLDPWKAADMFEEWFGRLNLPIGKNIVPLASNWPFDRDFIKEWLGHLTFEHAFHGHFRDTQCIAAFINDRLSYQNERPPFGRIGLQSLVNHFKLTNPQPHRAAADALASADVYREFVRMMGLK
jgi:DNA polymerase III epsilon subunit-like protein